MAETWSLPLNRQATAPAEAAPMERTSTAQGFPVPMFIAPAGYTRVGRSRRAFFALRGGYHYHG